MVKKQEYTNESISSLKGADRVRKRPAVIFGSDDITACQHSFFEILSNSIDEAREGYGNEITVIRHKDSSVSVIDKARGIPVDFNEKEQKYNWELLFTELYAGGKYNNNSGDSNYEFSLGLNGLGLCATQYASEYMIAVIHRDGYEYTLNFKKGEIVPDGYSKKAKKYSNTGTNLRWKPDLDVFKDIDVPLEYYMDVLKRQAIVNSGLKLILIDEPSNETYEYYYDNGIVDYLVELSENKNITDVVNFMETGSGKDREDLPDYKVKLNVAFAFNNDVNDLKYFHNSSYLSNGGSPDKAVRTAFTYEVDKYLKKNNKYTKNESKITFQDIQDSLLFVSNSFSTVTSYENQTKRAIHNAFIQSFMTDVLKKHLEVFFIENKDQANKVMDQILINKRSREKAETTRLNLKKTLSAKIDVVNRVKKFVDCRTKDVTRKELYIVEGDSALGSVKMARDSDYQALMPIRGKILNCLKADYDKIFQSDIIVDLVKVLGCGVEIKSKHNKELDTFNMDELKWDKIIICTDADVDGFQIRTLVLTFIYRLIPTLLTEGKVYIAESPLFEIENSEGEIYFAYNEKEKSDYVKKHKKCKIQRSKGLGENDPEMMALTTMNPKTRRLIQVMPSDVLETAQMFELLLGDDMDGRKAIIEEKGEYYLEELDLS